MHVPLQQRCPEPQRLPHMPQLLRSTPVSISQPVAKLPSQSRHVPVQPVIVQAPIAQPTDETDIPVVGQVMPHMPQLAGSVRTSTSQPLPDIVSQSRRPTRHVKPHVPAVHVTVAPVAIGQAIPHMPQFERSVARATSQPSIGIVLQSP